MTAKTPNARAQKSASAAAHDLRLSLAPDPRKTLSIVSGDEVLYLGRDVLAVELVLKRPLAMDAAEEEG